MIEGFKLKVDCSELREHCRERSDYHHQRAEEKSSKLPELQKSLQFIRGSASATNLSISTMNKGGYYLDPNDPIQDLERDILEHKNKSVTFAFYADHLFNDSYILGEADLVKLEILRK